MTIADLAAMYAAGRNDARRHFPQYAPVSEDPAYVTAYRAEQASLRVEAERRRRGPGKEVPLG